MGKRQQYPTRMPVDVHAAVRRAAEDRGVSMNEVLNEAVESWLAQQEGERIAS